MPSAVERVYQELLLILIPVCVFSFWGETHVGRAFLLDLPAFPGFQVDYVDIMKLACGPHALCAVRSCGGEKRPYGIPLIGCLQSRKFFCCQLEKASGTEVVDGCIRSFQIGRFVKGLLRVLYLFIPAPYLYIRAILSQKGRVFLFGLRSSSEEKRLAFSEKYKGAFSLIIHEAGNALSLVLQSVCRGYYFLPDTGCSGLRPNLYGDKTGKRAWLPFSLNAIFLNTPLSVDPVISFLRNVGIEDRVGYDV
mgnify:CR=1 FL=1